MALPQPALPAVVFAHQFALTLGPANFGEPERLATIAGS